MGVPINSDQLVNVKEAVNANIGLSVPWREMTEEKLGQAINEVTQVESVSTLDLDVPGVGVLLLPGVGGEAELPDPGPAPAPAGESGLVAGVPPQTSPQPGDEASHTQPQLGPVLPH